VSKKSGSRSSREAGVPADPVREPGGAGLECPACFTPHHADERFCLNCGMPLVVAGDAPAAEAPASEAHARARKIRPELARGELVRVAGGRNQA
jgi:hypothetical protein